VPPEIGEAFSDGETFTPGRVIVGEPPADARRTELRVRLQDVDPMRHVNNARYLDFVDEVLGSEAERAQRYTLEFLRPAAPDERLAAAAWPKDGGWAISLTGEPGDAVLRALVVPR